MPRFRVATLPLCLCAALMLPMVDAGATDLREESVRMAAANPPGRPAAPGNAGQRPDHAGRPADAPRGNPTPPGLRGELPPGLGGPNPSESRRAERPLDVRDLGGAAARAPAALCGPRGAQPVGPVGSAGRSHVAMLQFGEPGTRPGGRLAYGWIGPRLSFVLTAHGLAPGVDWTLTALDGELGAVCLGSARSNPGGNLNLVDSLELDGHLPSDVDPFAPREEDEADVTVALLPADAVDCDAGVVLDADAALIAADGLRYLDTDLIECPAP